MAHSYRERREVSRDWHKVVCASFRIFSIPKARYQTPSEILQLFIDELRQLLVAFEERFDVRVVWKKSTSITPDATAEFLQYIDTYESKKDMCQAYRVEEYVKSLVDMIKLSNKLKEKPK